jgi:hypothetical protein
MGPVVACFLYRHCNIQSQKELHLSVSPHPFFVVVNAGVELRVSHLLGRHCTTSATLLFLFSFIF